MVTFALLAGCRSAESCWTSWGRCKQGALQKNGPSLHKQARLSPFDISHHAHTACISIHNLSGGGHWGEEKSENEKEDNTVQEYSGTLSRAGSFNSLWTQSIFRDCCYLSSFSLNKMLNVTDWSLYEMQEWEWENKREGKSQQDTQTQTQIDRDGETEKWFECSSTILVQAGPTAQGLRKWLTLPRYHRMICTCTCVSVFVCVGRWNGGSRVWAANL